MQNISPPQKKKKKKKNQHLAMAKNKCKTKEEIFNILIFYITFKKYTS